ncbi:hypothetical protein J132_02246 [Termitomyces sp. J132]|nr:hypothetical protein J132_02246 [Termitomyces sp. J132]
MTFESRATGGYVQSASGQASFTYYSGCSAPACGKTASGYTAAINQLAFGAPPGAGAGDACGRCFAITGTADPISPSYTGPFNSIVVKVTDECPVNGNQASLARSVDSSIMLTPFRNGADKLKATTTINMECHSTSISAKIPEAQEHSSPQVMER